MFSIILMHYNQSKYIFGALDSILGQTYNNYEIIITDDKSKFFPEKELREYFEKRNFRNYQLIVNKKNIGTVKTLHKAIKKCTGEYILFFAADDELYDNKIIEKYAENLDLTGANVLSSKTIIYDKEMKEKLFDFPTSSKIEEMEFMSPFDQYKIIINGTVVAPGATVFRASELKKHKYLDSSNMYIEDWELFLKLTYFGNKIYMIDYYGLKHRGGGISENKNLPLRMKKAYLNDFDNIFKKCIIRNYGKLSDTEILQNINYFNIFNNFYDYKSNKIKKRYDKLKRKYDK